MPEIHVLVMEELGALKSELFSWGLFLPAHAAGVQRVLELCRNSTSVISTMKR